MSTSRTDLAATREHRPHRAYGSTKPYVGHLAAWFVVIPLLGTLGWYIGLPLPHWHVAGGFDIPLGPADEGAARLVIVMTWVAAIALAAVSLGIGFRQTGRKPWIVGQAAVSWLFGALLLSLTVTLGWSLSWFIVHFAGSAIGAMSWNMYRSDAFRSDSREKPAGDGDGELGEAVGIIKSKPLLKEIEQGEFATTIPFKLKGGETVDTLAKALPRLEAITNSLSGRGRVEPSGRAGRASVTVMHRDPFEEWLPWPGLSRPGGSFQESLRTAYYDTGRDQAYYMAADPKQARPRSAILRAGTTGAGKSGDFDVELAETLSRVDVHAIRIDTAKFMQNTAWALRHLTLGADTLPLARVLEQGVQNLAEHRIRVMGAAGHRDWTPNTFRELGLAAWLLQYDEADTVLAEIAEWLATKSLSAGIFMSVTIPSADHKSMPPIIRRSLGNRKMFGAGDDYTAGMVLSDSTRKNGPDPYEWGARFPGAHLLDRAPGVDPRLSVVSCRTFRAEHHELAAAVDAVRGRLFPAPKPTAGEIEALGDAWALCQPSRLGQEPVQPSAAAPDAREQIVITPTDQQKEVKEVQVQEVFKAPEYEPKIPDEDRETYNRIDPRQPIERGDWPNIEIDDGVPLPPDDETAGAEFDRVIREMWAEGKREFRNREVLERCRMWDSVKMTRHLTKLDAGKAVQPPGLQVRRRDLGRWQISQA